MPERRDHGWWPYLAPYVVLLGIGHLVDRAPPGFLALGLALKALVPGALLAWFVARGRLPELRGYRFSLWDVAVGVAIAALWVGPYLALPALPRGEPFDATDSGHASAAWVLGLRALGFAVVTPFVEELFVRSFLHRFLPVWDGRGDFRQQPIARYTRVGFAGTVVYFTLSHVPWEWWVALPTGVVFNLWLYRRGHIGATVVAHAVANASIWALVVLGPPGLAVFL